MRSAIILGLAVLGGLAHMSPAQEDGLTPAGPPGSVLTRMKTLNEIEPRSVISSLPVTITNSGAYVVIANLVCTNNGYGIIVQADDVTIDLNGFTLSGSPGSQSAIKVNGSPSHLFVRNGTIRGWGVSAVDAMGGRNCRYEDILAFSNGFNNTMAAFQFGTNTVAARCVAFTNKNAGFTIGQGSKIENCAAMNNGGMGMILSRCCVLTGCTFSENSVHGLYSKESCLVSDCLSVSNSGMGFYLDWNSSVSHCAAAHNASEGFLAGRASTISGCSALRNGSHGFNIFNGSVISESSAYQNGGCGIRAYADASIRACVASENASDGISAQGGSCVSDCLAVLHTNINTCGISLQGGGKASGNTCRNNFYGIYADSRATIADNQAVGNTNGIFAKISSFVIRNQACGSVVTNYSLDGSCMYGPIVFGSGMITNANPFANLSL